MDCPIAAKYQPALACFSVPNQHRILQYLAHLAARQYTGLTLNAVVTTLPALRRQLPGSAKSSSPRISPRRPPRTSPRLLRRRRRLAWPHRRSIRKSVSSRASLSICAKKAQMTQQPVLRRRHRLLTPTVLPKPIPDADLAAFFQVIDSVRDRLIFLFMLRCGLRVSEVCALAWDAIDLHAGTVRINQGKGQVDRIVYLSPDVERALAVWRAHHTPGVYLFPSPKRAPAHLFRSQINVLMDQYLAAAGLTRHYSPHCLRHTFATHLLNAGVSLEVLKELMGHHSIAADAALCPTL